MFCDNGTWQVGPCSYTYLQMMFGFSWVRPKNDRAVNVRAVRMSVLGYLCSVLGFVMCVTTHEHNTWAISGDKYSCKLAS